MASVPNMRLTPAPAGKSQTAGGEAPEADLFARLMATPDKDAAVTDAAAAMPAGDAAESTTKPQADEGTDQDTAALDLGLTVQAADFLPVIEAQAAAPVTAKPATPSDGDADPAAGTDVQVLPTMMVMTACALPMTNSIGSAAAPIPASGQPTPLPSVPIQAAAVPAIPAGRIAAPRDEAAPEPRVTEALTSLLPAATGQVPRATAKPVRIDAKAVPASTPTDPAGAAVQLAASLLVRPATRGDERGTSGPAADVGAPAVSLTPTTSTSMSVPGFAPPVDLSPAAGAAQAGSAAAAAPAEPAIERRLDLAQDAEWLDQLARDIAGAGERDGPMRFRLHPQTLGHLRVELTQSDVGTSVRLTADTEAARAILVDAQPRLLAEARAQGVRIAESHVDLAGSGERGAADSRRQDGERTPVIIRTAGGVAAEAEASDETRRSDSERYA